MRLRANRQEKNRLGLRPRRKTRLSACLWADIRRPQRPGSARSSAITPKPSLGQGALFFLTSAGLENGVAQLWTASPEVDAAGYGLPSAGLGEALLSPVDMRLVASTTLELGVAALTFDPIAEPSLVGVTVALQGLALGGHAQGQTLELSKGLWTQIQP
jgi:hypothetical protein